MLDHKKRQHYIQMLKRLKENKSKYNVLELNHALAEIETYLLALNDPFIYPLKREGNWMFEHFEAIIQHLEKKSSQ